MIVRIWPPAPSRPRAPAGRQAGMRPVCHGLASSGTMGGIVVAVNQREHRDHREGTGFALASAGVPRRRQRRALCKLCVLGGEQVRIALAWHPAPVSEPALRPPWRGPEELSGYGTDLRPNRWFYLDSGELTCYYRGHALGWSVGRGVLDGRLCGWESAWPGASPASAGRLAAALIVAWCRCVRVWFAQWPRAGTIRSTSRRLNRACYCRGRALPTSAATWARRPGRRRWPRRAVLRPSARRFPAWAICTTPAPSSTAFSTG
ncbi:MAG: hypothetical protein BWZ02_00872 [Lentisphaerae bacterium ADurb.BinA184]|nr:MAG: hypothetical protein BWZ02_00872 [Lentisphaerae bacterium ADurb.BinA184]